MQLTQTYIKKTHTDTKIVEDGQCQARGNLGMI